MLYNELLRDGKLPLLLHAIDEQLATARKAEGCAHCGGKLHRGNYERKGRGVAESSDVYRLRFSFCCAVDRRRATPPTVRFLGRRVYVALAVVLGTIIGHGSKPRRLEQLRELIGFPVDRGTVERWRLWWREELPVTERWKALQGLLRRPVSEERLPESLLEAFAGPEAPTRVVSLLRWLAEPAM